MSLEMDSERALLSMSLDKMEWERISDFDERNFQFSTSLDAWRMICKWHKENPAPKMNASYQRIYGATREIIEWLNVDVENEDILTLSQGIINVRAKRQLSTLTKQLRDNEIDEETFDAEYERCKNDLRLTADETIEFGNSWVEKEAEAFRNIGKWSTGFSYMDVDFRWIPGNMGVLTADTGKGKSFLGDDLSFAWARANGGKWGLIPLEMNRQQRASRWIKGHSRQELSTAFCSPRRSYSLSSILRLIEDRYKDGVQFWFVDHFHRIYNESRGGNNEWEARCSGELANLASRLGCYILVAAQISKEGGKKDAKLNRHDIRGAKQLQDDASDVLILERNDDCDSLHLDKCRFFPEGITWPVLFSWDKLRVSITNQEYAMREKNIQETSKGWVDEDFNR